MGTDYYPMIVFGLKVPRDVIFENYVEPRNDCKCIPKKLSSDFPDFKFCPECGQHLGFPVKKRRPKEQFEGFDYYDPDTRKIGGWPVLTDTDSYNFYIGYYAHHSFEYEKKLPFPDMSHEKTFVEDMKRLGLWDKGEYGAWLVLEVSY